MVINKSLNQITACEGLGPDLKHGLSFKRINWIAFSFHNSISSIRSTSFLRFQLRNINFTKEKAQVNNKNLPSKDDTFR